MDFFMRVWSSKLLSQGRRSIVLLFGLSALLFAHTALAAEDGDRFVVRTAYTELIDGVYYLNADIEYSFGEHALEALENSVPLTIRLQIEIIRDRRFWWNKSLAELEQAYEIAFHSLSDRYIVRNLNSGAQDTFANYRAAIASLGRVSDLPIYENFLLDKDARYLVRIRAILDIRNYSAPLRLFASIWGDWRLSSEYYEWTLQSSNE